jgi:hypothetical protein
MLKQISSNVFCWSELHGAARNEPYFWNSYVIRATDAQAIALVDPLVMSDVEGIAKLFIFVVTKNRRLNTAEHTIQWEV